MLLISVYSNRTMERVMMEPSSVHYNHVLDHYNHYQKIQQRHRQQQEEEHNNRYCNYGDNHNDGDDDYNNCNTALYQQPDRYIVIIS